LRLGHKNFPADWVADARGKAVKVIAYQLKHLPAEFDYRVIFMQRKIAEVLASWKRMGLTRAKIKLNEHEKMLSFKTEYAIYEASLTRQPHMRALFVQYNDLLDDAKVHIGRIRDFLDLPLDAGAMAAAIDPALYRNRIG
jgi:hypothetical protein